MISLQHFHVQLSDSDLAKYAGMRFEKRSCEKMNCRRDGDHAIHVWWEEILLTDEIRITKPKREGPDSINLPIRWHNFCFAVMKVMQMPEKYRELALAQNALEYAKRNCFDFDGSPQNMARSNQFSSYAKFTEFVLNQIKYME